MGGADIAHPHMVVGDKVYMRIVGWRRFHKGHKGQHKNDAVRIFLHTLRNSKDYLQVLQVTEKQCHAVEKRTGDKISPLEVAQRILTKLEPTIKSQTIIVKDMTLGQKIHLRALAKARKQQILAFPAVSTM